MGLVSKAGHKEDSKPKELKGQEFPKPEEFTSEEIRYIITKLQDATYKGSEFERFFVINKKLSHNLQIKNKEKGN